MRTAHHNHPPMLTLEDVGRRLRCSTSTAGRLVRSGVIASTKFPGKNGSVRVSEQALAAYLDLGAGHKPVVRKRRSAA